MSYKITIRGAKPAVPHNGLQDIAEQKRTPDARVSWGATRHKRKGATSKGDGEYISGLADYSGDPNAFCSTRAEAEDKLKRKGLEFERT